MTRAELARRPRRIVGVVLVTALISFAVWLAVNFANQAGWFPRGVYVLNVCNHIPLTAAGQPAIACPRNQSVPFEFPWLVLILIVGAVGILGFRRRLSQLPVKRGSA